MVAWKIESMQQCKECGTIQLSFFGACVECGGKVEEVSDELPFFEVKLYYVTFVATSS